MLAILLQVNSITDTGAVSADWTMTGAFIIIGMLLVFISSYMANQFVKALDSIKDELKDHKKKHDVHDENHSELKTEVRLIKQKINF